MNLPKDVSHAYLYIVSNGDEENCCALSVGPVIVDLHSRRICHLWHGRSSRFQCQCLSETIFANVLSRARACMNLQILGRGTR